MTRLTLVTAAHNSLKHKTTRGLFFFFWTLAWIQMCILRSKSGAAFLLRDTKNIPTCLEGLQVAESSNSSSFHTLASAMVMLCWANQALQAPLLWSPCHLSGRHGEQFSNKWNPHVTQRTGDSRRPCRHAWDPVRTLHARQLIADDWCGNVLEEALNLQCMMGSWPVSTKPSLCLAAMFVCFFFFTWRWRQSLYTRPACENVHKLFVRLQI